MHSGAGDALREDELRTEFRQAGRFNDSDDDLTAARIRQILTNTLHTQFTSRVTASRGGFYRKRYETAIVASQSRYRLPHRASALEDVQIINGGDAAYEIEGDVICFDEDSPPQSGTLRIPYYLRPSTLVEFQTTGRVTAVDPSALTVEVASLPTNRVTAVAVASGDIVDIVKPAGWFELALVGYAANAPTLSGTTFTFPAGTDLSDVAVGDYLRAAEQTDWPCVHADYHLTLAQLAAAEVLASRGDFQKSAALTKLAWGTENEPGPMRTFMDTLEPRVKASPQTCVPSIGVLRGRRRVWPAASM